MWWDSWLIHMCNMTHAYVWRVTIAAQQYRFNITRKFFKYNQRHKYTKKILECTRIHTHTTHTYTRLITHRLNRYAIVSLPFRGKILQTCILSNRKCTWPIIDHWPCTILQKLKLTKHIRHVIECFFFARNFFEYI